MNDVGPAIYLAAGAALVAMGFYHLMARRHLLRRILALNVMGSGVFLVFITLAIRTPGSVPDPIPHAMVLTGIVVSVCATALALALADRVEAVTGSPELEAQVEDDHGPGSADEPPSAEASHVADSRRRPGRTDVAPPSPSSLPDAGTPKTARGVTGSRAGRRAVEQARLGASPQRRSGNRRNREPFSRPPFGRLRAVPSAAEGPASGIEGQCPFEPLQRGTGAQDGEAL